MGIERGVIDANHLLGAWHQGVYSHRCIPRSAHLSSGGCKGMARSRK
jgi:hypothetical protein